jgi:hypothetical protein
VVLEIEVFEVPRASRDAAHHAHGHGTPPSSEYPRKLGTWILRGSRAVFGMEDSSTVSICFSIAFSCDVANSIG